MDMELDQGKILSWFNPFLCFTSALAVDCTMHVSVTHNTRNLSFPVTLNFDFFSSRLLHETAEREKVNKYCS